MRRAILKKDGKDYGGKYVAIRSFKNKEVLSFGCNPSRVLNAAKNKGARDPVIFFVPKKDTALIL